MMWMQHRPIALAMGFLLCGVALAQSPAPAGAPAKAATPAAAASTAPAPAGWPRHVPLAQGGALLVYSPQVTRWDGDRIALRSAVAIKGGSAQDERFGTLEATASTHVDKGTRRVALVDLAVSKIDIAGLPDRGASLVPQLDAAAKATLRFVSLDRLQASLAASSIPPRTVDVANTAPRIVVSTQPAILVPVDGEPVWKPVTGSPGFSRMINTRALVLKSASAPEMFLRVYDGWLMANSLAGPWTQPFIAPTGIDAVAKKVVATAPVDLLDGGKRANPKPSLAQGVPTIVTAQTPTELIVFRGQADFAPLVGTSLAWATNTTGDMLRDTATGNVYALVAGRWFRAASLDGPWTYVAANALPADFARIPQASLAGAVLQAVAGTPQARAAIAENAIPQTATVPRTGGPAFTASYDGAPRFEPEAGTTLARAVNAPLPIVRTADNVYYALKAGIWFTAAQANGPWSVATSVPDAIYALPPTSPIYYATFVRIYGVTPDRVFTGYTPGYLGAMVARDGTVVFGTGYRYRAWTGDSWYPAPATYGVGAIPVFNPSVGYTYAFATGLATADWSQPYFGGARFHPGYWGSYPCCASASADVYRAWFKAPKAPRGANAASKGASAATSASAPPAAPAVVPAQMTSQQAMNGGVPPRGIQGIAAPPQFNADAATAYANSGPQVPIRHMGPTRGYDMDMVSNSDAPPQGTAPASSAPAYISANAYYANLAKQGGWTPQSATNETYAGDDGNIYRNQGGGWQRHDGAAWTPESSPPPAVVSEAQTRANVDPGMAAGSYGMSNTTRFTGAQGDGWSRRDSGDGGYSRTLGGDGGISAERINYDNQVMDNAFDIDMNGGYWGDSVSVGNGAVSVGVGVGVGVPLVPGAVPGAGWGGRFGY